MLLKYINSQRSYKKIAKDFLKNFKEKYGNLYGRKNNIGVKPGFKKLKSKSF